MADKLQLEILPTGVPGLDTLLNGGISKYAFVVLTGTPGSGKTTLAHQIMFSAANAHNKALFFTIMGEPPLKMLRYQQQYGFFDASKVGSVVRYINLADDLQKQGFDGVQERIQLEIETFQPGLVFVDSFRSAIQATRGQAYGSAGLQNFVQRLSLHLSTWQATTFLIGEYVDPEQVDNPVFTVADGVIHLAQDVDQNAVVRKLRVVKMRGSRHMTGLHSFRITQEGLQVFPRLLEGGILETGGKAVGQSNGRRLSTGCTGLDGMLGGGIPENYSIIVAGPPGSGKTVLATAFLAAGVQAGESGIIASFEQIVSVSANPLLNRLIASGKVKEFHPASFDLSIEEVVTMLADAAAKVGARRVVIDSLSALELVLAPQFRKNFEESLFRMLSNLNLQGMTVMMIRDLHDLSGAGLNPGAFLVDGVIHMRYVERDNKLVKMISVPKLRGCSHSSDMHAFRTLETGIELI